MPVAVICQILGVPLEDEPTLPRVDRDFMAGTTWARRPPPKKGRPALEKGSESMAALTQYMAELIEGFMTEPGEGMLSKMVNDDGPDGPMAPDEAAANAHAAASPGMIPRST